MTDFELVGDDLDSDLGRFLDEMKARDPQMGAILVQHAQLLDSASTDEDRKQSRLIFNSAVKAELQKLAHEDA
ncbi:hypothetical protein [Rathayibacter rathayi]|uniref:hypothetical protein n=1 Tax=Rathayibacter rathayi TaxID=33887 RepID=UPI000FDBAE60|nr:hypothetical protein [Rathayibacter rathayi]MWV75351.1 hypothetical protein [Rathayibacter rathayi NCPPB 2980 = VKM Ac-1601]